MKKHTQHFENMQMMCRYFESNSKLNKFYLPEFTISKKINDIIENEENSFDGIMKILELLAEIDNLEHPNDIHWFDYKLHVLSVLRQNGFSENE
ncbi:hypothetical protein SAMN05444671_4616 [Flavobacterium sp. CF108]|uniref:hypothetical protein n=1 Tax=unclassified Flavobacterium TaxID=196869 RepID=UPI0008BF5984|nr:MULTISPECIES: hypothetical protein [unclassified Flavobacterium]SEP02203.1 hypothetical protein SAMN04487978_4202 [Flavobacterium sp. fv08]SHH98692.1 hypothetical protein SAMN05444671_4616 [Flavobacterium sp. CF108]